MLNTASYTDEGEITMSWQKYITKDASLENTRGEVNLNFLPYEKQKENAYKGVERKNKRIDELQRKKETGQLTVGERTQLMVLSNSTEHEEVRDGYRDFDFDEYREKVKNREKLHKSWQGILKSSTYYVEDGDAPTFESIQELISWMEYNEDPKLKKAGKDLSDKFDEYFNEAEDKLSDLYSPEFFNFQNKLKKLAGAVTSKMGLRRQYLHLVDAKRLVG